MKTQEKIALLLLLVFALWLIGPIVLGTTMFCHNAGMEFLIYQIEAMRGEHTWEPPGLSPQDDKEEDDDGRDRDE